MKSLLLALLLAVTPTALAQDAPTFTRQTYTLECVKAGTAAGNTPSQAAAVCTCSSDAIAHITTGNRHNDFELKADSRLINDSIAFCVNWANTDPYTFAQEFGQTQAQR